MSEPKRVALVGCGAIAQSHADAIADVAGAALVGCVDPDAAARDRARTGWGCEAFATLEELLQHAAVDVAAVCVPPHLHQGVAGELLQRGIHVLCEKPLAPTSHTANAMIAQADEARRVLMVSSKFRFVRDLLLAGQLVREGAIGDATYYEVTFCAPIALDGGWRTSPDKAGGGVVMDNASHALDVLDHVLDSPIDSVSAGFSSDSRSGTVERTAEIQFVTQRGTLGRIGLSWTYFTKDLDYLMVQGATGGVRVGWGGGLRREHGEREWSAFGTGYDKRAAFRAQLERFLEAVAEDPNARASHDPGRAVAIIESIYRAQRERRWLRVVGEDGAAAHASAASGGMTTP